MKWFEHRIPPPVVGGLAGVAMWLVSQRGTPLPVDDMLRHGVTVALVVAGLCFDVLGLLAFRAARTTVNPLHPDKASNLVSAGVYRVTRNPMYLGMLCLLLAWAAFLAVPAALLGPLLFVLYITRFQIIPEERILRARFGDPYDEYLRQVRRWI
ncbi:MAG: isoprenylcysteine carboxylmethyltransferase family protein [Steroidobacteraceae bacterium]